MEKTTNSLCLCTVIFIILMGFTACDNQSLSVNRDSSSIDNSKPSIAFAETAPNTAEFTIQASATGRNVDIDANNPMPASEMAFDYYISDINQVSSLNISTPTISPNALPMKAKALSRAYKAVPEQISYNGYSTLSYTVEGTNHSFTLNADQKTILNELQQSLNELQNGNGNGGKDPETFPMIASPNKKKDHPDSFAEMTDKQIKKWLKKQGYKKVQKIGGGRFQVTRKFKNKGTHMKKLIFVSVFNANTGNIEPHFQVAKNGKTIFNQQRKKKKWKDTMHFKSKMKRKTGKKMKYILMDIIRNQKN